MDLSGRGRQAAPFFFCGRASSPGAFGRPFPAREKSLDTFRDFCYKRLTILEVVNPQF
jgi:hypothetical protein